MSIAKLNNIVIPVEEELLPIESNRKATHPSTMSGSGSNGNPGIQESSKQLFVSGSHLSSCRLGWQDEKKYVSAETYYFEIKNPEHR